MQYFNYHLLSVGSQKCEVINFDFKSIFFEPTLTLIYNTVEITNVVNILGSAMDNKLSWRNHVEYVFIKISKGPLVLCNLILMISEANARTMYFSLMYSHL